MRVLVTGSREWKDAGKIEADILQIIRHELREGDRLTIIHGGARGADSIADRVAEKYGLNVWRFPALWRRYGRSAGVKRNIEMLDTCQPDLVLAYPLPVSTGTVHCIEAARDRGIPIRYGR